MTLKEFEESLNHLQKRGPKRGALLVMGVVAVLVLGTAVVTLTENAVNGIAEHDPGRSDGLAKADGTPEMKARNGLEVTMKAREFELDEFLGQIKRLEDEYPFERPRPVIEVATIPDDWTAWTSHKGIYCVNRKHLQEPGMPLYVALMSRFVAYGSDPERNGQIDNLTFYDDLRWSATSYVLDEAGFTSFPLARDPRCKIREALECLESNSGDRPRVAKFAVHLMENYRASWTYSTLAKEALRINEVNGVFPRSDVVASF